MQVEDMGEAIARDRLSGGVRSVNLTRFSRWKPLTKTACGKWCCQRTTEGWRPVCQTSAHGGGRSGRSRGYASRINGALEARHSPFPVGEFRAAPLALLYSGFGTHGSKPAAFHRGLTFSKRAYGPQVFCLDRFPQHFSAACSSRGFHSGSAGQLQMNI
jgi:hypothetical protein